MTRQYVGRMAFPRPDSSGWVKLLRKTCWSQAKRREHEDETSGARRRAFLPSKKAQDAMANWLGFPPGGVECHSASSV